jgi:transcriptional regulator with XRE-family HTH domain
MVNKKRNSPKRPNFNEDRVRTYQTEVRQRIAMKLTELRVARGWSQAELASRAGVGESMIEEVESATAADLRIDTLTDLASGLDVPVALLLEPRQTKPH